MDKVLQTMDIGQLQGSTHFQLFGYLGNVPGKLLLQTKNLSIPVLPTLRMLSMMLFHILVNLSI